MLAKPATSGMMNTDVLVYHGATDAPQRVDVDELAFVNGEIINALTYSTLVSDYLELPT